MAVELDPVCAVEALVVDVELALACAEAQALGLELAYVELDAVVDLHNDEHWHPSDFQLDSCGQCYHHRGFGNGSLNYPNIGLEDKFLRHQGCAQLCFHNVDREHPIEFLQDSWRPHCD